MSLHTQTCTTAAKKLAETDLADHLAHLPGWVRVADASGASAIEKTFTFKNYHHTMAFVNATAWISHQQDHHPDMRVHYNRCIMLYTTHDAGGLTLNDLICAARVDRLVSA